MDHLTESLALYRELADRYDQLGQLSMRDRFLMLAADAALQAGRADEAERLRQRLLQQSRHHMLRPYHSFAEAASAPDVQTYLADLRANYPPDLAAQLLDTLRSDPPVAVEPTRPAPSSTPPPAPSPIPATAPLLDTFGPRGNAPRPTWQPATPYRLLDEPATPPARPASPPIRPTMAVPAARPLPPRPAPGPPPAPEPGGVWLSYLLLGAVLTAGLALALYTLARPFLP
jgi:hypothetical protein